MDQEMKAKIDELMKAHGTHELSLDEMDKINGGAETVIMDGREVAAEQFNSLFLSMAEAFDLDTAISIFSNYCGGFRCAEMEPYYSWSNHNPTNRDRMGVILYKYWAYVETGKIY